MVLRRMDRLVLMEILIPFLGSTLLFTSLFFAGDSLVRITQYWQDGIAFSVIAQLFLYSLPGIFALTFPMAMLLAALLGFSRLSNDLEITALVATGIRFERILLPAGVFAMLISFIGLYFNSSLIPAANRQRQDIIDAAAAKGIFSLAGSFDRSLRDGNGRLTMQVHAEGGIELGAVAGQATLRNVSINLWDSGRMKQSIYADRADWVVGTNNWKLSNFEGVSFNEKTSTMKFAGNGVQTVPLGTPIELAILQRRVADLSTASLQERAQLLRSSGNLNDAREAEVEIARRVALPFATFIFAMVGAPLGVRPQRTGRGVGFGLSVLITFVYWMSLQVVSVIAQSGTLPANFALMLPNIAGVIAAFLLIRRVMR